MKRKKGKKAQRSQKSGAKQDKRKCECALQLGPRTKHMYTEDDEYAYSVISSTLPLAIDNCFDSATYSCARCPNKVHAYNFHK